MKGWVYDKVMDKNSIVALCFHPETTDGHEPYHPSCLIHIQLSLKTEGLALATSEYFPTLQAAKENAWQHKHLFSKGLD